MEPSHTGPLAASLPADLLRRIFDATASDGSHQRYSVLSFEERAQAEAVSKHWRAALAAEPGSYIAIAVSRPAGLLGGWVGRRQLQSRTAGLGKATARARALAARAPSVDAISLDLNAPSDDSDSSVELMAAYAAALQALLDRPGQRSLQLNVSGGSARDMLQLLASVQSSASLARLSLSIYFFGGSPGGGGGGGGGEERDCIALAPGSAGLVGLPHVNRLDIMAGYPVVLALPVPHLETFTLSGMDDEMGGVVPPGSVQLGHAPPTGRSRRSAAPLPPLFPALRCASIEAQALLLSTTDAPAVESLTLELYSPDSQLVLPSGATLPALTSLNLTPSSIYSAGFLGEVGEVMEGWDIGLHSNGFAPLLAAAAASPLADLDLCLGEAADAAMQAALRGLARLTSLRLRFADPPSMDAGWMGEGGDEFGGWGEEEAEGAPPGQAPAAPAEPKHTFDCRLLAGMASLEAFATSDGGRLEHTAALAGLPALRTLRLPNAAALPALAPSLPHLTCLELQIATPQQVAGDAAACAALRCLPGLRRVVVGTTPTYPVHQSTAARTADRQALTAIAKSGRLQRGCVLVAAPHY